MKTINYKPPKITVIGDNSDCGISANCPLCYFYLRHNNNAGSGSNIYRGKRNALYCTKGHKLSGKDNDYNKAILEGIIEK